MTEALRIERVLVIGAGTMGAGIAQVLAQAELQVALADIDPEARQRALGTIERGLRLAAAKGWLGNRDPAALLERVRPVGSVAEEAAGADLVIEAVPERMDLKREIFAELGRHCQPHALLATNTSSLPVTAIAGASGRPERVLGLHFFNPPPLMPLVEIVRGERTAEEAVEAARAFVTRLGKEPIVVRDVPGFATSRLGLALGLEAMRMVEEGVASPADIDRAMELGYRHPMGPLKLTDLVGLDVRLDIAETLHRELGERFRPPQILRRMVRAGKLGRKSGEGFYRYDAP
ncbi:MAG: putative 3-hydroxyacyl-CoA dehydrogenase [Planctomycetota bacterium]|nr:MAG: putative 3-hydroxyacyl-CoA dehydrogenase [Planctomycetota bacterium]